MDGSLDHIELYVSDLGRSADFWGWLLERLGFEPYQDWPAGRSWRKLGTYIVFVQAAPDFLPPGYHRKRVGLNHLAFRVPSRKDVDILCQELRERGTSVLYEDRHPYAAGPETYAVFFEDPNRIKVEVVAKA